MWSHDSFQYALNPLNTLKLWNEQMTVNGMLVLAVPQTCNHVYNRFVNRVHDGCFFNHNVCNLMYMLAVTGFDCKDAYVLKEQNDPWLHIAVYKTDIAPMDPAATRWYDLIEAGLVSDSIAKSINKHGFLKQEDIIMTWLDRNWHYVKD